MWQSIEEKDYRFRWNYKATSHSTSGTDTFANTLKYALKLADALFTKQIGEYMGVERLFPRDTKKPWIKPCTITPPTEIQEYLSGFIRPNDALVVSWAHLDNDPICVMLDKIMESSASSLKSPDGYYGIPADDVWRIYGNEWSIMFRLTCITNSNGQRAHFTQFMGEYAGVATDITVYGDMQALESDVMMYKLMGLQLLEENT